MATTIIKSGDSGNQAIVDDTGHLLVTGSAGNNASVGENGDPAPTSSTLVAGIDPDGDLKALSVDENGHLNVNTETTVTNTVTTSVEGLNSFQTSQYVIGTSAIQITPTPLVNRSSLSLRVTADSGVAIFIGPTAGLTLMNGYPLYDGDTLQMDITPANTIYAISDTPGQVLFALEVA